MRQNRHLAASSLCNDLLAQFVSCGQDNDDLYGSSVLKSSHLAICAPSAYAWFPKQHDERSYARLVDE